MLISLSDKVLMPWLEGKEYLGCSDEAEAVGIAAGYYKATGKVATVAISADGFMNCMNFLTSWVAPEGIPMHLVISIGREEIQHKVATQMVPELLFQIEDDAIGLTYEFVRK